MSRFILWTLAVTAMIASAGLNGAYYYSIGGAGLAVGLIAVDLLKPLAFRKGNRWFVKLAGALILVPVSLFAGVGYVAGERLGSASQAVEAATRTGEIRAALSTLKEHESADSLQLQAAAMSKAAEREGKRGYCGPVCENYHMKAAQLTARAANAERRERLEVKLEATAPKATPKDALVSFLNEQGVSLAGSSLLISLGMILALEFAACAGPHMIPSREGSREAKAPTREELRNKVEALTRKGLKQKDIASRLKISQGQVSKLKNQPQPSKPKLRIVA